MLFSTTTAALFGLGMLRLSFNPLSLAHARDAVSVAAAGRAWPLPWSSAMGLVLYHTCTRAMVIAVPTEFASRGAKHVQNRIAGDSWERH
jgi:hypothetical protein